MERGVGGEVELFLWGGSGDERVMREPIEVFMHGEYRLESRHISPRIQAKARPSETHIWSLLFNFILQNLPQHINRGLWLDRNASVHVVLVYEADQLARGGAAVCGLCR